MNELFLPHANPLDPGAPQSGLYLAITLSMETERVTELIASLALRAPLNIVAGSEWIPNYGVARLLRRRVTHIEAILGRIQLARAFTCYQLLDLLAGIRPGNTPVLVLDALHTFYTDDIPLEARRRTLEGCGRHLQRLSLSRPVAVLAQRTQSEEYPRFYTMLASLADTVHQMESAEPAVSQPGLF
ncbi:MAG TPA: hypothetical protein VIU39_13410 [Anaerolineales bacterium]|jgi:hypothetical protein